MHVAKIKRATNKTPMFFLGFGEVVVLFGIKLTFLRAFSIGL